MTKTKDQIGEELARLVLAFNDSSLLIYDLAVIKKMCELARQYLNMKEE